MTSKEIKYLKACKRMFAAWKKERNKTGRCAYIPYSEKELQYLININCLECNTKMEHYTNQDNQNKLACPCCGLLRSVHEK
jgi:hypothetical protein